MKALLSVFLVLFIPQIAFAFDSATSLHDPADQGTPASQTLRVLTLLGADYLVGGNEFSVADDCFDPSGDHFHSDDGGSFGNGPDFVEVGNYSCEVVSGMVEFSLAGLLPRFTAEVNCSVYLEGGLFSGVNDFLTVFDIDVVSYNGNNAEDLSDFEIAPTYSLGSFSTDGMVVGDEVSFDVTDAYNAALAATSALGVRMEPASDPAGGAITFEQCNLLVTGKVVDIDIKFCSNPNAFNTKKKGGFPVTIFGTDEFDVGDIDLDTLQICMDAAGTNCTPTGLKDYSFYDRGEPGDAGTATCIDDLANPDGFPDLDAVFHASDVADLIGPVSKGDVVGPLYLVGYLNDATPITSVPVNSIGVDWLAIKK